MQDGSISRQPEYGLREQKRLRTRHELTDAATSLVLEKGYSKVNIEDICAVAGISRRTFFNYFDSKDQAIFGAGLLRFNEDDAAEFGSKHHDNVVEAVLELIEKRYTAEMETTAHLEDSQSWNTELRRRRREIIQSDPQLAYAVLANFKSAIQHIRTALSQYFTKFPDDRIYGEVDVEEEVTLTLGIVRECILFVSLHSDDEPSAAPLHDAAEKLKIFTRRFQW